jgi:TP901 family phage tail tape measure protein
MSIQVSQLIGLVSVTGAEEGAAKLDAVGAASEGASKKLALLATGAAVLAGGALVVLAAKFVEVAGNFQQGVNRLRTGGGDIQDTFTALGDHIKQVSIMSGILTGPLIDAMYQIVSANQRGAQAYATLAAAAQGAQIEQANVVDVTKVLTTLQTNWGTKLFTAAQYMSGLVAAVSQGKLTLEQLSTAMSPILPIAAQMGISFKDVAAAMSAQTNAGLDANRAATGLQAVFVNIENPTKKAAAAMKEYGVNSVAVADEMKTSLPGAFQMLIDAALKVGPIGSVAFNRAMADMVGGGTRTAKTIDALTQHMSDWTKGVAGIGDAMRSHASDVNGWAIAQGNFNIQMDRAKASVQVFAINLGTALLPYATKFISFLISQGMPILTRFSDWFVKTALPAVLKFTDWIWNRAIPYLQQLAKTVEGNLLGPLGDLVTNIAGIAYQIGQWLVQSGFLSTAVGLVSGLLGTLVGWVSDFFAGLQDGNPLVATLVGLLTAVGTEMGLIKLETFAMGLFNAFQQMQQGAGIVANLASKVFPDLVTAITGVGPAATGAAGVVKVAAVGMSAAMGIATLGFSAAAGILVTAFLIAKDHIARDFAQMSQAAQKTYDALGKSFDDSAAKAKATSVLQQAAAKATADETMNQGSRASAYWASSYDKQKLDAAQASAAMILSQQAVRDAAAQAALNSRQSWDAFIQWFADQGINATGQSTKTPPPSGGAGGPHGYQHGGPVMQTGLAMVHKGEYVIPAGGFRGSSPASAASSSASAGSGTPIILQINGYQLARLLMPHIVANIRNNVGVTSW